MGAGALIGAIIGAGLSAAGSAVLGTTLLASAITGAALGSIFDRKRTAPVSPTYEFGKLVNTHSQALPVPIIYGRVKVGGNIIYHKISDDKKTVTMAVGIGEGEIDEIEQIYVDDVPIEEVKDAKWEVFKGTPAQKPGLAYALVTDQGITVTAKAPGPVGKNISIEFVDAGPDKDLQVSVVDGTRIIVQLETGPEESYYDEEYDEWEYWHDIRSTVNDVITAINADPVANQIVEASLADGANPGVIVWSTGRRYLSEYSSIYIDTEERWPYTAVVLAQFSASSQMTSTPTITALVRGKKVPVWDAEAEEWVVQYTNNPAWCVLDFLRSKRYGVGIEDGRIDFESFYEEAQYCDELVPDGNGGMEPRFRLDYVIDYESSSLDAIEDMLATFRAYLLYTDGKLRLKIEKSEAPAHAFTMDNIVHGSFSYSKASRKDIPNRVVAEWVDPEADFERVEIAYDNEIDQDRRGEVYSRTVTLLGVTRPGQAGRMARFYHDSAFWANTFCEFRVGIDALHCEVGDVVQVSHDVPGWDKKLFRILEIEEAENDEALLRLREYVPAIYHDLGVEYQPGKDTTLPSPFAPPPHVEDVQVGEIVRVRSDGTIAASLRVVWTAPEYPYYYGARVYWRSETEPEWIYAGMTDRTVFEIPIAEPGEYEVLVQSESISRITAPFETAPTATIEATTKTAVPPEPPDANDWSVSRIPGGVEVRWNRPNIPDWDSTEIHMSQSSGFNPTGWDGSRWTSKPNSPAEFDGSTKTLITTSKGQSIQITSGISHRTTWYVKIVHVDTSGNRSDGSVQEKSITIGSTRGTVVVAASDASDYWKSVADYICDGINDEAEINAALATGETVELSEGTFTIVSPISMPKGSALVGQREKTVIQGTVNGTNPLITLHVNGHQTVERLVLDGLGSRTRGIANQTGGDPDNIRIQGVSVKGFVTYGMHLLRVTNCRISDCQVTECLVGMIVLSYGGLLLESNRIFANADTGVVVNSRLADDVSDLIMGNHCIRNGYDGLSVAGRNIIVTGNVCSENVRHGIHVPTSSYVGGIIDGNVCNKNGFNGMHITNHHGMTISGNNCSENGTAGIFLNAAQHNVLNGNFCRANGQVEDDLFPRAGIVIHGSFSHGNTVQGNIIRKGDLPIKPDYGIHIGPFCEDNFISNNDLLDSGTVKAIDDNGVRTVTDSGNRQ